jgi:hypothetical protein
MLLPGLTAEESKGLILSVGTHHGKRPLSPMEVAKLFKKALFHGASREECASFVRLKGPDMVLRFLRLLDLNHFVQHSTDWRQTGASISFTSAWRLSTLPNKAQEGACIEIMANQLTTKEVEQVVQLKQRSGRGFAECLAEVVGMRPTITKIHVILGAVTDDRVKEWLGKLSQVQRDGVFTHVLAEAYPAATSVSGRLGTEKFSIVTNEQGYTLISRDGSFETSITKTLAEKMVPNHV